MALDAVLKSVDKQDNNDYVRVCFFLTRLAQCIGHVDAIK